MANTHYIYPGTNQNVDSNYGSPIGHYSFSMIGTAVNAQSANQLNEVARAVRSGIKNVEVQMTFPDTEKAIPNQHLDEINALRKMTGVDLTLHAPMIEPTGMNPQARWDPSQREQAEKQLWNAVERGARINTEKPIVVTIHASTSIPEPETKIKIGEKNGVAIEKTTHVGYIDVMSGELGRIKVPEKDYLDNENKETKKYLEKYNEDSWSNNLNNLNLELGRAKDYLKQALEVSNRPEIGGLTEENRLKQLDLYKNQPQNKREEFEKELKMVNLPQAFELVNRSEIHIRDSTNNFKKMYNQAYEFAEKFGDKDEIKKLDKFGEEWRKTMDAAKGPSGKIEDYSQLKNVSSTISKGLQVLNELKAPEVIRPIKEFAMEQAAETFSNLALNGYNKFGSRAPIISMENHPAGPMSGFNRADEIKELIVKSQDKFIEKAMRQGVSEEEAKKKANALLGATWDVGHINMMRKFGYNESDLKKQMETIAPFVKNIHLADNFGFDHAELPMGMGNVPMESYEKILKEKNSENYNKIKRVIEAGDWVTQFQGASPIPQTLMNYGSPVYAMQNAPYWNQIQGAAGGYFTGYGNILPDLHFSTLYGSGFSNLPVELGGQIAGRSRVSGNPLD